MQGWNRPGLVSHGEVSVRKLVYWDLRQHVHIDPPQDKGQGSLSHLDGSYKNKSPVRLSNLEKKTYSLSFKNYLAIKYSEEAITV